MRKLLFLGLDGILLVVAVTSLWSVWTNRHAVARAEQEARHLAHQRDSVLSAAKDRSQLHEFLLLERARLDSVATRLRDSVNLLESARSAAQLTVREIRTTGKLQSRLRAAFPQLGPKGWGLTTIPMDQRDTIGIQYLLVPAWFAETFVIDRANATSWREQKDKLLAVDSLQLAVSTLQDSVTRLVALNAHAYRTGYDSAYASYATLNRQYVAQLKTPRLRVRAAALGLIGAAGLGFVAGTVVP